MYRPGDYLMAQNAMKKLSEEQFGVSDAPVSEEQRWWEKYGLMFQRKIVVTKEANPSTPPTITGRQPLKNRI